MRLCLEFGGKLRRRLLARLNPHFLLAVLYLADWNTATKSFVAHGAKNPHPIPTNYSTDVQPQLQEAIGAMKGGDTLVFPKLKWNYANTGYKVEQPLRLRRRANLTFTGNGAIIRRFTPGKDDKSDRTRCQWDIQKSQHISFDRLAIYGASPPPHRYDAHREAQHGFNLQSSSDVTISNCTIQNTYGDGICVAGKSKEVSKHITISNNNIENTGRDGIALVGGDFIVVDGNTFKENRHMMDIEPETRSASVDHVRITNNIFGTTKKGSFDCNGAGRTGLVYMANNKLPVESGDVVWHIAGGTGKKGDKRTSGPLIYLNNTAVSDSKGGKKHSAVTIWNQVAGLVAGNQVKFTHSGATAIRLRSCSNVLVGNNVLNGAAETINKANADNCREWNNTTSGSNWKSPVVITTIPDRTECYSATMPFKDGGHVYAIWRLNGGKEPLTCNGLKTTAEYAVVVVNANGAMIQGYGLEGASTYKGAPLK